MKFKAFSLKETPKVLSLAYPPAIFPQALPPSRPYQLPSFRRAGHDPMQLHQVRPAAQGAGHTIQLLLAAASGHVLLLKRLDNSLEVSFLLHLSMQQRKMSRGKVLAWM